MGDSLPLAAMLIAYLFQRQKTPKDLLRKDTIGLDMLSAVCNSALVIRHKHSTKGIMKTAKADKPRLDSITILRQTDCDADVSHIGEYTDEKSEWAIERATGEYVANLPEDFEIPSRSNEYRFFVPCAGGEKPGSKDYQKYGLQDYQRMESLNNGCWNFIGIYATAEVSYDCGNGSRRVERMRSGGLWGIESDSGEEYIAEVCEQELSDLKSHLERFGVNLRNWPKLVKEANTVNK